MRSSVSCLGSINRSQDPLWDFWHTSEDIAHIPLRCVAYLVERTSLFAALREAGCPHFQVKDIVYPSGRFHRRRVVLLALLVFLHETSLSAWVWGNLFGKAWIIVMSSWTRVSAMISPCQQFLCTCLCGLRACVFSYLYMCGTFYFLFYLSLWFSILSSLFSFIF